jgi:hypothetical protein
VNMREKVKCLPVYTPDCTDGPRGGVIPFMLEEPLSGEWVKLADVLALLPPETAETPRIAHSKSEYKRLKTMGANVLCPHGHDLTRVICPHGCRT